METRPFDLTDFPFAAAEGTLMAKLLPLWQRVWFRASTIAIWAILSTWIFTAPRSIALVFPLAVFLWFANIIAWQKTGARARERKRQAAFSSRETYTVTIDEGAITLASPHIRRSYPRGTVSQILDWRGHILVIVDALGTSPSRHRPLPTARRARPSSPPPNP